MNCFVNGNKELVVNEIISNEETECLFSSVIENIKIMSDQLLDDITKRSENWTNESEIGDIFLKIAPFFNMYVEYCNINHKAGEVLERLMKKNRKFKLYIEIEEKSAMDRIESVLITPIQRIPRYKMLLDNALK